MLLRIMALVTAVVHMVSSQDRGGTILEQGSSSDSQSVIVTPRTRAFLSCESGDIVVKVNFTLPFRGLMYAHRSRTSPCRIHGTGATYYELRIPLKGCGTWQESPRVFVNNVTIRFHSALELEEDETKTVVCRYPPPLTQPPGTIQIIEPHPKIPTVSPTRVSTARLSEVEILILICLLLFLSLLTLGIGIAYFCLKRRNVRIVRHRKGTPSISAPPSQLTRLSSSHRPNSASSVLGHTVRIPRAVPYSAPPPGRTLSSAMSMSASSPFEEEEVDFRTSSSAEATSEETSASSSSSEDQSRNLLYRKVGPKSILSIPKAILRSAGGNRWRTQQPAVHQFITRSASGTSVKGRHHEREDQTVTTVLEPEIQFDEYSYYAESLQQGRAHSRATTQNSLPDTTSPVPVYAQVDKHRKTTSKKEVVALAGNLSGKPPLPPGHTRRRQVVTETPEEHQTSEEVTKNTTVTTSVRREVKETRIDPELMEKLKETKRKGGVGGDSISVGKVEDTSLLKATSLNLQKPPKSILVRDVSDVYLTTTVETELRELTTKVSKDVVEQHAKATIQKPENVPTPENVDVPFPDTRSWNVVIRHRTPDIPVEDPDASCESNGDSLEESKPEPQFQVKIRAIPPEELKPKNQMITIPPLEMPSAVDKLREVLKPNVQDKSPTVAKDDELAEEPKESVSKQQRSVRWTEDTKEATCSTVSSSDSFQSSESLRERSSSEVLEVAPTLPSQQHKKDQPSMLERSTSEIVTSPEDHSRWVGGVVPVLETLSPEFLANIPVVAQGGFFNRQRTPTITDTAKDAKKV